MPTSDTQRRLPAPALLFQVAGQVVLVLAHILLRQVSIAGGQDGGLQQGPAGAAGEGTLPGLLGAHARRDGGQGGQGSLLAWVLAGNAVGLLEQALHAV